MRKDKGLAAQWANTASAKRAGLVFAQCNSTLLCPQTNQQSDCGSALVSRTPALCQMRFDIPRRDMSMFTSCSVRFCSRVSVRRAHTSHSDVDTTIVVCNLVSLGGTVNGRCKR